MKLGFDAKRAFFNGSGLGYYSRTLLEGLALASSEHEFHLYSPKTPSTSKFGFPEDATRFQIHTPKTMLGRQLNSFWRSFGMGKQIARDKVEIFHGLSHELPVGLAGLGLKSVVTIHDLIFKEEPSLYPAFDREIYDRKVKHACRVADRIITISEVTKKALLHHYEVDPAKIRVVYQGVNPVIADAPGFEERRYVREKYGLPDEFALFVGNIEARKQVLELVKAIDSIPRDRKVRLVVVGNGKKYLNEVKEYVRRRRLSSTVIFTGRISDEELRVLYKEARMLVYPARREGFGLPVVEGMTAGIPVVTADVPIFREVAGKAAVFVDPQDSEKFGETLLELWEDRGLRELYRDRGLERVQLFDRIEAAKKMLRIYKDIGSEQNL